MHYLGDNSVAVDFPHRSAKKFQILTFAHWPLMSRKVVVEKASVVYKHEIAAMKDDRPLGLPRNVQCSVVGSGFSLNILWLLNSL